MKCPDEIARIILQILHQGILRARSAAWSGRAEQAADEADHIHNLPELLRDYKIERLNYYWNIVRIVECATTIFCVSQAPAED